MKTNNHIKKEKKKFKGEKIMKEKHGKISLNELQEEAARRRIEPITALYGILNGTLEHARGSG